MAFHPVELVDVKDTQPHSYKLSGQNQDKAKYNAVLKEWPTKLTTLLSVTNLLQKEGYAFNDEAINKFSKNEIGFVALLQYVEPIQQNNTQDLGE